MVTTGEVISPALKDRVTRILTDPKAEWPVIAAETTTTEKLYREYIMVLAAIPAIAGFIGGSIIGTTLPFVGYYRVPLVSGIVSMIVTYALTLASVWISAFIISKLAPTFDSTPSDIQALKLVAYASTAAWLAGVFNIIVWLSPLAIIGGLYSIYLFYVGLPVMMKTPEAKVVPYMVVAALVVIVATFLVGILSAGLVGPGTVATL